MKKTIIQGAITVFLFFGTWFVLTKVDWVKIFNVQKVTDKTEQKLGELFWDVFKKQEKEIIIRALKKNRNKRKHAARDLGISERTLYRKIKQYDLEDLA
jgi:transcriptional regulator with PAS, ATPase and Fis domain